MKEIPFRQKKRIPKQGNVSYNMFIHKLKNKDKKYIRRERSYGKYQRSFYLGDIDEDKIEAKFEDGTLLVTIPKKEIKETKKYIELK